MWGDQDRSEVIYMPKYLTLLTSARAVPSTVNEGGGKLLHLFLVISIAQHLRAAVPKVQN